MTSRSVCTVYALALAATLLAADLAYPLDVRDCVAKVQMNNGSCGSGTQIQPGYVITAAHVTEGHGGTLIFPSGQRYRFTLVAETHRTDLALVHFDGTEPWTQVAAELPPKGAIVWGVGYPGGGPQTTKSGPLVGVIDTGDQRAEYTIHPGDSGGGMFTAAGELIGVQDNVFVPDPHEWCNAVGLAKMQGFLGLSWGRQPSRPGPGCPGGVCPTQPPVTLSPIPGTAPPISQPAPPPAPAPVGPSNADLAKQIADIAEAVKAIKPIPGPAGKDGPAGPAGPAGPSGKDGNSGAAGAAGAPADPAAVAALTARIAALETKLANLQGSVVVQLTPTPAK